MAERTVWRVAKLGDLVTRVKRPVEVELEQKYTEIGVRSHAKGIFVKEPVNGAQLGNKQVYWVEPNCIVVNIVFAWETAIATTGAEHDGMIASHRFPMFKPNADDVFLPFLFLFLTSGACDRELKLASPGGAGRNRTLNQGAFLKIPIVVPSLNEQRYVANIAHTWDRAIHTTTALLKAKVRLQRAVRSVLLSGKRRLGDFTEPWTTRKIGEVLKESRVPGSDGAQARKLTVKLHGRGVQAKVENRAGSPRTQYYRRSAGQFIYSKLDFLNGAFGLIPPSLEAYESTQDLPAFDVTQVIHPPWLLQYVGRNEFYASQRHLANGGRKARRVNVRDFLGLEIPVPSLVEQRRIASVLETCDREVRLLRTSLGALKLQRKALVQQLLTSG